MNAISKKTGVKPGKTVAVIGGVHGNERIGVDAVRSAAKRIVPSAGTVYFIEANPAAIEKNARLIGKNLNRCFIHGNDGATPEDVRARELMRVLDTCDASLDVHASNSKEATPFVICEPKAFDIARLLPFSIVSSGWDAIEPGGTDGYMHQSGKIGLCIECGSVYDAASVMPTAVASIEAFLRYFGITPGAAPEVRSDQTYVRAYKEAKRRTNSLAFSKPFADFERLTSGEVFARDGEETYVAEEGDLIIFPRADAAIGAEAFILGKKEPFPALSKRDGATHARLARVA